MELLPGAAAAAAPFRKTDFLIIPPRHFVRVTERRSAVVNGIRRCEHATSAPTLRNFDRRVEIFR
jgi:hypothetical protein